MLAPQRRNHRLTIGGDELELPAGHELRTLPVPDAWSGLAIDALPPAQTSGLVVVLAIQPQPGGDERFAATPDLVLQAGWQVVVLGRRDRVRQLAAGAVAAAEDDDGTA
jgi:hypothetical protein